MTFEPFKEMGGHHGYRALDFGLRWSTIGLPEWFFMWLWSRQSVIEDLGRNEYYRYPSVWFEATS